MVSTTSPGVQCESMRRWHRPLAAVVVGGLVTSTVLTLLVLPALYRWFVPRAEGEHEGVNRPGGRFGDLLSGDVDDYTIFSGITIRF